MFDPTNRFKDFLPKGTSFTFEQYSCFYNLVRESYILVADEDYLAARLTADAGLIRQPLWLANQALEKYTKALFLVSGMKPSFGHDWANHIARLPYSQNWPKIITGRFGEGEIFDDQFSVSRGELFEEINKFGKPDIRYDHGAKISTETLAKIDSIAFLLRKTFFENSDIVFECVQTRLSTSEARGFAKRKRSMSEETINDFEIRCRRLSTTEPLDILKTNNYAFYGEDCRRIDQWFMSRTPLRQISHKNLDNSQLAMVRRLYVEMTARNKKKQLQNWNKVS